MARRDGRAALGILARGALLLSGISLALHLLEQLLGPGNLGGVVFGALGVDLAIGRAGVRWDPETTEAAGETKARRAARGAFVATVVALVSLIVAFAVGACHVSGTGVGGATLVLAVVRACAVSARDELLFRGLPLTVAARAGVPPLVARGFAALLSGAAIVAIPSVTPAAFALAVASGWLFASLWQRDRGAWAPIGAHAAWALLLGSAVHGGVLDVEWTSGELAIGAAAAGLPAWIACGVCLLASAGGTAYELGGRSGSTAR